MRDFSVLMEKGREAKQDSLNGLDPNAPKYCRFYAIWSRKDQEDSPDKDTDFDVSLGRVGCILVIPLLILEPGMVERLFSPIESRSYLMNDVGLSVDTFFHNNELK
uniref:Uncharacterized protein n=1 Tax=Solanum tuberosum TaxID=4113 RepID=M1DZG6_SOLTU